MADTFLTDPKLYGKVKEDSVLVESRLNETRQRNKSE